MSVDFKHLATRLIQQQSFGVQQLGQVSIAIIGYDVDQCVTRDDVLPVMYMHGGDATLCTCHDIKHAAGRHE